MTRGIRLTLCLAALLFAVAVSPVSASATSYGVMAWGANEWAQLGTENTKSSTVPETLITPVGVTSVSVGGQYSLALLSNGTVEAWGINSEGELGNGSTAETHAHVKVKGLTNVVAISAGSQHALALLATGHVMAWGEGFHGELGNGKTTGSDEPVEVTGLTEATAIAAGNHDSLALRSNHTVVAWGDNELGELGDGTTTSRDEPVEVAGLTGVTAISAIGPSLALLESGAVEAWGANEQGQLGDGSEAGPEKCINKEPIERKEKKEVIEAEVPCSRTPVAVSRLSEVTQIAAGSEHALALVKGGAIKAWGSNQYGQLGDGSETGPEKCAYKISGEIIKVPCSRAPVSTGAIGLSGATAISAGWFHSLALTSSGTVKGWGLGWEGQLGNGMRNGPEKCKVLISFGGEGYFEITGGCSRSPIAALELKGVTGFSAGGEHSLAFGAPGPVVTSVTPGNGSIAGGTHITITGAHFTGATKVDVGGAEATEVKVESDSLIKAVTPAGTVGAAPVRVTTPEGTIEPSAGIGPSTFRYTTSGAPEFGRCVKVSKGTGKYKNANCTEALAEGNYEWTPGVAKAHFTLSGEASTLETVGKEKVTCTGSTGAGEYSGVKTLANTTVTFTKCALATSRCQSAGASEGEVVTGTLEGTIGWRSHEAETVGLDLAPEGEAGSFMELQCGATRVAVRGSVIVSVKANKMQSSTPLKYEASKGKQKIEKLEGLPVDVLEASIATGAYEQAGLTTTLTQTNEEEVEINASV